MSIWLYVLLAHLVGDYVFQSDFIAKFKKDNMFIMLVHVLLYSLTICATLSAFGLYTHTDLFLLVVTHFIIDIWKCYYVNPECAMTTGLYIDQALHIFVLIVLLSVK